MFLLVPTYRSQLLEYHCLDYCAFRSRFFRMKLFLLRNDIFFRAEVEQVLSIGESLWSPRLYVAPLCLDLQPFSCFELTFFSYEYSATISPPGQEGTYMSLSQALPSPKQNHKPQLFPITPPSTPKPLPVPAIRSTSRCWGHVRRPTQPLLPPPWHV